MGQNFVVGLGPRRKELEKGWAKKARYKYLQNGKRWARGAERGGRGGWMMGGSYRPVPDAKDGGAGSLQRVWAVLEEGSFGEATASEYAHLLAPGCCFVPGG